MFDKTDPRSKLNLNEPIVEASYPVQHVRFHEVEHDQMPEGSKSWWTRGANYFMNFIEAVTGETLTRINQIDEYVLILFDPDSKVTVTWEGQKEVIDGYHVVIIPSGNSEIQVLRGGKILQLFTVVNQDLAEYPINKESYTERSPALPEFKPWAESPNEPIIRAYDLNVREAKGRFGRVFRCSTFMLSFLYPWKGPRDHRKLSPHLHTSIEQTSFCFEGDFVHHFRWPWGINREQWKPDQHDACGSPSVSLIPPGVIHTTEALGEGRNELVDIFCPPRDDFAKQDGWVLNEEDYPYRTSLSLKGK